MYPHLAVSGLLALGVIAFAFPRVPAETAFARPLSGSFAHMPRTTLSVLFGGDMMFDRSVREAAERYGDDHLLACLDPLIAAADIAVANLEGPITPHESVSVGSAVGSARNFTFTFPLSTAALLAEHDIRFVALGNNHIGNFGDEGIRSTLAALDAAAVASFGDPLERRIARFDQGDIRLSFIGYNQFALEGALLAASTTLGQVSAERALGRLPIVFAHWGEEYQPAYPYQKELAHAFVDAGAVFVVGAHPHVVQESEEHAGVPIYYSLGNLIFDQYWDESVRRGLTLLVTLDAGGVLSVAEMPVYVQRDRQTCPHAHHEPVP